MRALPAEVGPGDRLPEVSFHFYMHAGGGQAAQAAAGAQARLWGTPDRLPRPPLGGVQPVTACTGACPGDVCRGGACRGAPPPQRLGAAPRRIHVRFNTHQ